MTSPDDVEARLRATLHRQAESIRDSVGSFDPNRVTDLSTDSNSFDTAAWRTTTSRWARLVTVAAAVIVLVVAGGMFAVSRAGSTHESTQVSAASSEPNSPISIDSLNGIFVATATEFNGPVRSESWLSFVNRAFQAGFGSCLHGKGSRFVPNAATSGSGRAGVRDNTQFPDIVKLKAGTFTEGPSSSVPTTTSPTLGTRSGSQGTSGPSCDSKTIELYESTAQAVTSWVDRWSEVTKGVDADPKVLVARADYVTCMANMGIEVTGGRSIGGAENGDVFDLADEATRQGDTARVAGLARAYGMCFEQVSKAMDAYRLARRAEFYRVHAAQLRELATQIDRTETQLSDDYGIPLP